MKNPKIYFSLLGLFISIILGSCNNYLKGRAYTSKYQIYKIDSLNSYYLVNAQKEHARYKIVIPKNSNSTKKYRIKVGNFYNFELKKILSDEKLIIDGKEIEFAPNHLINCIKLDVLTTICQEKDSVIVDLYWINNLREHSFEK